MTWTHGNDLAGMAKILAHAAEHGIESIEESMFGGAARAVAGHEFCCNDEYRYRIKRKPREWWVESQQSGGLGSISWRAFSVQPTAPETIHVREVMDDE